MEFLELYLFYKFMQFPAKLFYFTVEEKISLFIFGVHSFKPNILVINPLTLVSDQDSISLYNINII